MMLDKTFAALADPTRRSIVEFLVRGDLSVGELVEEFPLTQSAVSRHLQVLEHAGLVARRIVCDLSRGQSVRAGERFGLIRFGSRADIYLPDGVSALVAPGQRMVGGESVIADLASDEGPRMGEAR